MPVAEQSRNHEIQVLRGVAVLYVVLQHLDFFSSPAWLSALRQHVAFWSGVDLFFCISGFVIAQSLLRGHAHIGQFRLSKDAFLQFWVRRACRLLPVAWLWALAVVALGAFVTQIPGMQPMLVLKGALAGMFGYANFYLADCAQNATVTFNVTCPNVYANSYYWSLSREEQFYLILSAALLIVRMRTVLALGLGGALIFTFMAKPPFLLAWNLRFEALVLGMGCYVASSAGFGTAYWTGMRRGLRQVLLLSVLLIVALAGAWSVRYASAVCAIASAIAVSIAALKATIPRGTVARLLEALGERSYTVYLCHIPAFIAVNEVLRRAWPQRPWGELPGFMAMTFTGVVVTLLLSEASYRLVERPSQRLGRQLATRLEQRRLARLHPGPLQASTEPGTATSSTKAATG